MKSEYKTLGRHSFIYGMAEILKRGIGFLMIPVYTHFLLASDYGLIELVDLTINIIGMLVGLRIGGALIRYYHFYEEEKEKEEVYTTALITIFFISLFVLLILFFNAEKISQYISGSSDNAYIFTIAFICLFLQNNYLVGENYLLAQKKSVVYSFFSVVTLVSNLSFNILFVVVFKWGVLGIIYSMLIAKSINFLLVFFSTLKGIRFRFSKNKLVEMVKYGLPLIPVSIGLFVMHFSDRFFLQKFHDLSELGVYSLAYKFGFIISMLIAAPIFKTWNSQRFEIAKQENSVQIFSKVFTMFLFVLVFSGLAISLFIDEVIFILTPEQYHGASSIVPLIVLSYIAFSVAGFMNLGNMITGNTKYIAKVQIIATIFNIILNIFLIKEYGSMGAAVSTLLSFSFLAYFNFYGSQKAIFIPFEYKRIVLLIIVSLSIFISSLLVSGNIYFVIFFKIVFICMFPLFLFMVRFFSKEEIEFGKEILGRLVSFLPFGAKV